MNSDTRRVSLHWQLGRGKSVRGEQIERRLCPCPKLDLRMFSGLYVRLLQLFGSVESIVFVCGRGRVGRKRIREFTYLGTEGTRKERTTNVVFGHQNLESRVFMFEKV